MIGNNKQLTISYLEAMGFYYDTMDFLSSSFDSNYPSVASFLRKIIAAIEEADMREDFRLVLLFKKQEEGRPIGDY